MSFSEISAEIRIGFRSNTVAQMPCLGKKSPTSRSILSTIPSKGALTEAKSRSWKARSYLAFAA